MPARQCCEAGKDVYEMQAEREAAMRSERGWADSGSLGKLTNLLGQGSGGRKPGILSGSGPRWSAQNSTAMKLSLSSRSSVRTSGPWTYSMTGPLSPG